METNERANELFNHARTQTPKTSYTETSQVFQASLAAAAGGGVLTKWTALSFKFKFIIMFTAISIISVTSLLVFSSDFTEKQTQPIENQSKKVTQTKKESANNAQEDAKHLKITVLNETAPQSSSKVKNPSATNHLPNLEKLGLAMIPREMSSFNQKLAPTPLIKKPKIAQDSLTMKLFEISEKTTNQEIETIKQQAIDAGLDFTFDTKIRQNKIKKLDLQMKKGTNKWMSKISGTDSFSFTFGWWEDAEGQYVKYICDDDLTRICGSCD